MIKLISFADGEFIERGNAFYQQVESMRLLDEIHVCNRNSLDKDYLRRHGPFMLENKKGFGYYIWKSQVVKQACRDARDDDLIIYLDAGFALNPSARNRFQEYLDTAQESEWRMLSFFNIHTEYKWTKKDLALRLGVGTDARVMNTSQLSSGFFIFCPTDKNRAIIDKWASLAVEDDYHFSSDAPSKAQEHPDFEAHRHDQSIFSVLRKARGTTSTFYEVHLYDQYLEANKSKLPVWATRLRK
jgi:hypothetical protein